ncbi:YeiH family protein [Myroides sp. LJL116]
MFFRSRLFSKIVFIFLLILCFFPFVSPGLALFMGVIYAQIGKHPFLEYTTKYTSVLLQVCIVALGFGMNLQSVYKSSMQGLTLTLLTIVLVFVLGYVLGRILKLDKKLSYLISSGTAICGGSAIASISPVIKASSKDISLALGVVFILNAIALFVFPILGHYFAMSQEDFGLWCAIAIHDTSSVVGAAKSYGAQSLEVATTVKLSRALWIIPLTFLSMLFFKNKNAKIKIPYFIVFFVVAIILNTYVGFVSIVSPAITYTAKLLLGVTLFLIGSNLRYKDLLQVGIAPLLLAIGLWIVVSVFSLVYILY